MDISSWDGTLSSQEFYLSACAFLEKWRRIDVSSPSWSWVSVPKSHCISSREVEGYLSLEKVCFLRPVEEDLVEGSEMVEEESSFPLGEDLIDCAELVQSHDREAHYYDFHILYSASFRVPLLYFRAYSSDGLPLSLSDIEKYLPSTSTKLIVESKWTFITQEEHPCLNRPWFKLHPCGTSEWMKLLFLGDVSSSRDESLVERYLPSWLSVVGQIVDLRIPFQMLKE